jgi:hypothetical protein
VTLSRPNVVGFSDSALLSPKRHRCEEFGLTAWLRVRASDRWLGIAHLHAGNRRNYSVERPGADIPRGTIPDAISSDERRTAFRLPAERAVAKTQVRAPVLFHLNDELGCEAIAGKQVTPWSPGVAPTAQSD